MKIYRVTIKTILLRQHVAAVAAHKLLELSEPSQREVVTILNVHPECTYYLTSQGSGQVFSYSWIFPLAKTQIGMFLLN